MAGVEAHLLLARFEKRRGRMQWKERIATAGRDYRDIMEWLSNSLRAVFDPRHANGWSLLIRSRDLGLVWSPCSTLV